MGQDALAGRWTVDDSIELYGVRRWSAGYFDINSSGEAVISVPFNDKNVELSLPEVVTGIQDRGYEMPVLLRVENILDQQLSSLNQSFRKAIVSQGYSGEYRGVFPIKVNQQQPVLEQICFHGNSWHHGLEAGSKAELIAALAMLDDREACLICNGYKDTEFVDLALDAVKMGFKCFLVIERPGELDIILDRAEAIGVEPLVGVRLKLSSQVSGNWSESGGDRSIFGLMTAQLISLVDKLKSKGKLDCLKLLHYHLGSQIPNIREIRQGVTEAVRFYTGLVDEGAPMGYFDIGGGLAVDYDGSRSSYEHSKNYSMDEYAEDIIEVLISVLEESSIPHPVLISESGRATVAYYSVLLANVLDRARYISNPELVEKVSENLPELIVNLKYTLENLGSRNLQESFNDAIFYRDELRQLFKTGGIGLRERALGENIFLKILHEVQLKQSQLKRPPVDEEQLETALADIYYVNLSIFQSLPDSWAIDQVFPVMPIHHLDEEPTVKAVLADITCDCDGVIDRFIDPRDVKKTIEVHDLKKNQDYYLGFFLVGAYQETLGDLHNLFGDTNVVSIRIMEDGSFVVERELEGDSIADVLSYVEYEPKSLMELYRKKAERAVSEGVLTPSERKEMMKRYEESLRGSTYYEKEGG